MEVTTDHIFRMGQSHEVCEDYAASYNEPACVILGDGCSVCRGKDGKPVQAHTDFGSRLLVRAAREVLKQRPWDQRYLQLMALQRASIWAKAMGFGRETLSSTLLMAWMQDVVQGPPWLRVIVSGDGIVAVHNRDPYTGWRIHEYSFTPSPPYYLRYELKASDRELFMSSEPRWNISTYRLDGGAGATYEGPVPNASPLIDGCHFKSMDLFSEYTDMVAIFSDGVQSFTQKLDGNPTPLTAREILPDLLAFKNTKGEFVKRRAKRALADFASRGIHHQDDFSMAVISVQGDPV